MSERKTGLLSLLILALAFLTIRYPLFSFHGMKSFPLFLLYIGVIVIFFSGIVKKRKILPSLTVTGYIIGFILAYLFQSDYGDGLNNLWIIWSCVYLIFIIIGFIFEYAINKKAHQ